MSDAIDFQALYEEERAQRIHAEEKLASIEDAVKSDADFLHAMHYNPIVLAIAHIAVERYKRWGKMLEPQPGYYEVIEKFRQEYA
jgi:hypothetical protein